MKSASDQFLSLLPTTLGFGPHCTHLIIEAQRAVKAQTWVSVIILAATIIDVIRHEDSLFEFETSDEDDLFDGGYFEAVVMIISRHQSEKTGMASATSKSNRSL